MVDESTANNSEQDRKPDKDQRGKAGRLVGDRIEIRRKLGKQAQEVQDPSGSEPAENGVPPKEQ
jgi:hypothetical protein